MNNSSSINNTECWVNTYDTKVLISEHPAFKYMLESINRFIGFVVEEICLPLLTTQLKKVFSELFISLNCKEQEECVEFEDYIKESEVLMENPKLKRDKYLEIFVDFQESLDLYLKYDIVSYCKYCVKYIRGFAQVNCETFIRYQLLNDYPLKKARGFDDYPSKDKSYIDFDHINEINKTTPKTIREQIIELCTQDIENLKESISRLRAIERSYNEVYNVIDTYARQKLLNGLINQKDMEEVKQAIDDIKMKVDTFLMNEHQKTNYLIEFASDIILLETTRIDETDETSEISYIISMNLKEFRKVLNQDGSNNSIYSSPFFNEQFSKDNISFDAFVNTLVNLNNPNAKDTDISDMFYLKNRYQQNTTSHSSHESNPTLDSSHLNNGTSEKALRMSSDLSRDLKKTKALVVENIVNADYIQGLKNTFDITLKLYRDIQSLTTTALKPAERIKEPVECIDEVNFVWTEWEIYCQEFVKTIDELETLKSIERVETYLLKRISDLIVAFDAVSAKLMNLQNISSMPVTTATTPNKRNYNEQRRRRSTRRNQNKSNRHRPLSTPPSSRNRSRTKILKNSRSSSSISMKSSLSKDQLASLINEEIDLNNNGSDEMLGSEKEKSSNHDSNDIEDTDEYNNNANTMNKEKSLRENYQFTDRNNGNFIQDDMGDTPQGQSIEELDKEISKNNDIIYGIQENIKLSNKVMAVSAYTNDNNDDTYSSTTNPSSAHVHHAGVANASSNVNANSKQQGTNVYSNEDEGSSSSSPKRVATSGSGEEDESIIHSMILPEEERDVPKISERNLQAMKILYRIRDKLNGYDPQIDPSIMDVTKHVDKVINQAINIDNLACMYEGWTSWI